MRISDKDLQDQIQGLQVLVGSGEWTHVENFDLLTALLDLRDARVEIARLKKVIDARPRECEERYPDVLGD